MNYNQWAMPSGNFMNSKLKDAYFVILVCK